MSLKQRALNKLREFREEGMADECYGIDRLAVALDCTELELFDREQDTGVLFDLGQEGLIGFTGCGTCVYPQGGRLTWED